MQVLPVAHAQSGIYQIAITMQGNAIGLMKGIGSTWSPCPTEREDTHRRSES
jgi:hypothetical protein